MNLKQLSVRLGLSPTTVSRALNGYADVSEATRRRVVEMAEQSAYKPNALARRLALGKADAIGIVYPLAATYLGDPRFLEVLEGITARCNEERIDVLIVSPGTGNEVESYQRLLRAQRVDGLIIARTQCDDPRVRFLRDAGFPFVSYGRTRNPSGYAWFDFDNELGARLAVERLVALGHRRIAYLHANPDLNFAAQRRHGFMTAMAAAGLEAHAELVREAGFLQRQAYIVMNEMIAMPQRPSAVIVDNNLAGVGVIRATLEAGLQLGRDCSLIVYDGLPQDALIDCPQVTAIEQPTPGDAGRQLAELMLGVLRGKTPESLQVLWKPLLRPGTSDGPAP